ncbi:MAG TPA: DPP IV N-terminal domain-containing protein [Gemmatimonadales bacterium]|nr:DPP IV N-terminal domain-containing protein [Gemmatimonadales bacterium]
MKPSVVGKPATVVLCLLATSLSAQKAKFPDLRTALLAGGQMNGAFGLPGFTWIDGGKRYSYIKRDRQSEEIRAFDPATGKDTLVFNGSGLTFPDSTAPFSYNDFQWTADSRNLVFETNFRPIYRRSGIQDFYVYSIADHALKLATRDARSAELSPDGGMLGLERGGNMYVYDFASKHETQLTKDASELVYNGHFDWVYEEEFGQAQAWKWSPDSRHIAYWQVDEHAEPVVQFSDYQGLHQDWTKIRIPQPGDSNPTVKIGVVDVKSGASVWLNPGLAGEYYVPRLYWTSRADTLAVVTLNRRQDTMRLFFFDVKTGGKRLVLTKTSNTWIDVYDFYAGVNDLMTFPAGRTEFYWLGDEDGWQHIYRYDYSGRLLNQVTKGKWIVARVEGMDPARGLIYYTSTQVSPLERQLYEIHVDGTGTKRLTTTAGNHHINMSPDTRYYTDRWSSLTSPQQVELWATGQKLVKTIEGNEQVKTWMASHEFSAPEIFSFTTSDSVRLDGSIVKPIPFDPAKRYPVVFDIYGGPGSQQVYNDWSASGWDEWLAEQGYIVIGLNNRPANNYGSTFMKAAYKHLGKYEAHDFAEAAKYLATLPYVDSKHVAIIGTSYGGFSTLITMEMYPDLFPVGVANSAVADWRLYDTIYTERYMGLLGDNQAGYAESSPIEQASKLTGHLLLVHSMMDDNVHPQNTMQLITALDEAGHPAPLMMFPEGHHGAAYDLASYLDIQNATFAWLERYMKGVVN